MRYCKKCLVKNGIFDTFTYISRDHLKIVTDSMETKLPFTLLTQT